MSLLNKIKGLGRKDGGSLDQDTLEQDGRYDEQMRVNGTDVPDLALPGNEGAATLDMGALPPTGAMDSSIISEAAPSELAEFSEARAQGGAAAAAAALPLIGWRPLGEQQRILGGMVLLGIVGLVAGKVRHG